jgi:hypothetical protein
VVGGKKEKKGKKGGRVRDARDFWRDQPRKKITKKRGGLGDRKGK